MFMAVGRPAMGETAVHVIEDAMTHEEAAKKAALEILEEQHEDWNDNIFIDVVTDQHFEYQTDFVFAIEDLKA